MKKHYIQPTLKVVEFAAEAGFAASGDGSRMSKEMVEGMTNTWNFVNRNTETYDQAAEYEEDNTWTW